MRLSIIVPVLNEAPIIKQALQPLQGLRERGHELIVVDGESADDTLARARQFSDQAIACSKGRAHQMNTGASKAQGDILLFLHADTTLPALVDTHIQRAAHNPETLWGRFDVKLSGKQPLLRIVEYLMNHRSRLTGIATGDQAIFVRRDTFLDIGGFPEIQLMEDIAISTQLKRLSAPACLKERVVTSSRRWEHNGIVRTILKMWRLRIAYFFGADPDKLAARYYDKSA